MGKLFSARPVIICLIIAFATGCSTARMSWNPNKKYSPERLQEDFEIFKGVLEESHPGLYWYSSEDSMNHLFAEAALQLRDSLTESEFRMILSKVIAGIRCGHTTVKASRPASRYRDSTRKVFPYSLKLWDDTAVVVNMLKGYDSLIKRGYIITHLNGQPVSEITDSLFDYISADGYNLTLKYQLLSNRGGFGAIYHSVFGEKTQYEIRYIDSTGIAHTALIPSYSPSADTSARPLPRAARPMKRKERKAQARAAARSLEIDTAGRYAIMDLNSFGKGYRLKSFFRRSFKKLHDRGVTSLIIDLRSNGGGNVGNSTLLTRYIANNKFRLADSLYALTRNSYYADHIETYILYRIFMWFTTSRKNDGYYHYRYFERHEFKPRKKHHFDGTVYVLTGGNTFSAATMFAEEVGAQENVILVGEETGGGAYGNNAWLIPDVKLPNTGIKFRLPLFRLVIDAQNPKNGRGVMPEIEVRPGPDDIRKGKDVKLEAALEMIKAK